MNFLDINHDIIDAIVSLLTIPEARSLTVLAKKIHLIAKRRSLAKVTIGNEDQLREVFSYLDGDPQNRLRYLRSLSITWSPTKTVVDVQPEVVIPVNFDRIRILLHHPAGRFVRRVALVDVEKVLKCVPHLGDVIVMLPFLQELELQDVGWRGIQLVGSLLGHPRKLILRNVHAKGQEVFFPLAFLPPQAEEPQNEDASASGSTANSPETVQDPCTWTTQESLCCLEQPQNEDASASGSTASSPETVQDPCTWTTQESLCCLEQPQNEDASASGSTTSSPETVQEPCTWTTQESLRCLELDWCDLPGSTFIRAFPNLRTLRLAGVVRMSAHESAEWREKISQWEHLDSLEFGSPYDYSRWPVKRPMRRLVLRNKPYSVRYRYQDIINMVRDTIPVVFVLESLRFMHRRFWEGLAEGDSRMRVLHFVLRDHPEHGPRLERDRAHSDLLTWLNDVEEAFASSALVCICLHIVNYGFDMDSLEIVPVRLAMSLPSLRLVSVQVETTELRPVDDPSIKAYWWQVSQQDKQPPIPISDEVGEYIMQCLNSPEFAHSLKVDDSWFVRAQ